jgi:hypothetical protein
MIMGFSIFIGAIFLIITSLSSADRQAQETVDEFYSFEQDGNFADSWKLFHPYMKQKFTKSSFIQDRSHVFIGHFGAETFTYEISEPEEIEGWRMEEGQKSFKSAYKFQVMQNYKGKYGAFSFQQDVFVVKHKEQWVILWDYNK